VGLAAVLGVPHISTGDLFRDHVDRGTRLGERARRYMDAGDLVPDDVTRLMVRDRLSQHDATRGFILDGYPRTRLQASALDVMLTHLGRRLEVAVYLRVSDGELYTRLMGRGRDDDNMRTVRNRLRTFHRYNAQLLEYYRGQGLLEEVDGEGDPDDVAARLRVVFA
jgi:adenylate kinase